MTSQRVSSRSQLFHQVMTFAYAHDVHALQQMVQEGKSCKITLEIFQKYYDHRVYSVREKEDIEKGIKCYKALIQLALPNMDLMSILELSNTVKHYMNLEKDEVQHSLYKDCVNLLQRYEHRFVEIEISIDKNSSQHAQLPPKVLKRIKVPQQAPYPHGVIQMPDKTLKNIVIKKLDCKNKKHQDYFQLLQFHAKKYMEKFNKDLIQWDEERLLSQPFCDEHQYPIHFFPKSPIHYIAYDKETLEIYGWIDFTEISISNNTCVCINIATTQGWKEETNGDRIKYIGSNLFLRLLKYCVSNAIDFIVFQSANPFIMQYGKMMKLTYKNFKKMIKREYQYFYFPLTHKKPNTEIVRFFTERRRK